MKVLSNRNPPHQRLRVGLAIISIAFFIIALYLAVAHHYAHFYELLVGGLAGLLASILGSSISKRTYLLCFVLFLALGLVGDLFFGLFVTKLWYYNFAETWEYLPLYIWVYPLAGIVMFQSYVLVRRLFNNPLRPKTKRTTQRLHFIALSVATAILIPSTLWWATNGSMTLLTLNFTLITVAFVSGLGLIAYARGNASFTDDLLQNPKAVIISVLVATYGNLALHEFPNTQAWEWVYTNLPWQSTQLLQIPIAVYPGWLALGILPVAVFYAVRDTK